MNDPRINFVCYDFPDLVEHIDTFTTEEEIDKKLDSFVSEILGERVSIDKV